MKPLFFGLTAQEEQQSLFNRPASTISMHRFSTSHDAARTATLSIWPGPKYETEVILRRSKIAKVST